MKSNSVDEPFEDIQSTPEQHFVILFISVDNVPTEASSVFLRSSIRDANGDPVGATVATMKRSHCKSIVWNSFRDFKIIPPLNSTITIEIVDGETKDILGHTPDIPIDALNSEDPRVVELIPKETGKRALPPTLIFQRKFIESAPPMKKTFFLVRHGESKWNRAQMTGSISLLLRLDHPLTGIGIQQAQDLQTQWTDFHREYEDTFQVPRSMASSAIKVMPVPLVVAAPGQCTVPTSPTGTPVSSRPSSPHPNSRPNSQLNSPVMNQGNGGVLGDLLDFDMLDASPAPMSSFCSDLTDLTLPTTLEDGAPSSPTDLLNASTIVHVPEEDECNASHGEGLLPFAMEGEAQTSETPSTFLGAGDGDAWGHIGDKIISFSAPSSASYGTTVATDPNTSPSSKAVESACSPTSDASQFLNEMMGLRGIQPGSASSGEITFADAIESESSLTTKLTESSSSQQTAATEEDLQDYDDDNSDVEVEEDEDEADDGVDEETRERRNRASMRLGEEYSVRNLQDLRERMIRFRQQFACSSRIYSSPLTRAIETSFVAFEDHRALIESGLTLLSCIREIKGVGGLDSVGVAAGDEITARVATELEEKVGKHQRDKLMYYPLHPNDASSQWWTPMSSSDSKEDQKERTAEFLCFARFCGDENPIFVGHSLFIKHFCNRYIRKSLASSRPELAADLKTHKLSNATVLAVTVAFGNGRDVADEIVDAELVFGGGFQHSHDDGEDATLRDTEDGRKEPKSSRSRFGSLVSFSDQISGIKSGVSGIKSMVSKVFDL